MWGCSSSTVGPLNVGPSVPQLFDAPNFSYSDIDNFGQHRWSCIHNNYVRKQHEVLDCYENLISGTVGILVVFAWQRWFSFRTFFQFPLKLQADATSVLPEKKNSSTSFAHGWGLHFCTFSPPFFS